MLNKEICRKCTRRCSDAKAYFDDWWDKWEAVDCYVFPEIEGKKHIVTVKIMKPPPEHCPYALEHILEGQKHAR